MSKILTKILNRSGLRLHPCLRRTAELKNEVIPFDHLTAALSSLYMETIKEIN